jgi:ribosomal protein L11 methyltransferase
VNNTPKATYVARLTADEVHARRIVDALSESLDPASAVCAAFAGPDGRWRVDVHFEKRPDEASLRALVALAAGPKYATALVVERLAPRNWIKESLKGLKPVTAGRFVVHGSHDRARVPSNRIGIEIEAATAFGTGHHGTTRGCLLALDQLARGKKPRHILDLGSGSGVLAIAAAKAWHVRVLATDIDPVAVRAARDNASNNAVGGMVEAARAAGLRAPQVTARAPFDLVLANILLGPLQRLAAPLARHVAPGGQVVLSGLLTAHGNAAIAAYRAQNLTLARRIVLDGWVTLVMVRKKRTRRPTAARRHLRR